MKAITTRYHGPTAHRGARIIASDEDGNRLATVYDEQIGTQMQIHGNAAAALARSMGWGPGVLQGGSVREGYVWVWVIPPRGRGPGIQVQVAGPMSASRALAIIGSRATTGAGGEAPCNCEACQTGDGH
jgi:hypothetical protein